MMQPSYSSPPSVNFISGEDDDYNLVSEGFMEMDDQNLFLYLDQELNSMQSQRTPMDNSGLILPISESFSSDQAIIAEPSMMRTSLSLSGNTGKEGRSEPVKQEISIRNVTPLTPPNFEHEVRQKAPDPKMLKRLAQNREAARKCRLRKKAYVQQLEHSRMKLTQLEQELETARAQGIFFKEGAQQGLSADNKGISSDTKSFDIEYKRWEDDHDRLISEMRMALETSIDEKVLRDLVDKFPILYDEMLKLKRSAIKSDTFHIISGTWRTPAERCLLWVGGFRPSNFMKTAMETLEEPLNEKELIAMCELQQSVQEMEGRVSRGVDVLFQFLSDSITSDALTADQISVAMNKLSTLQGFAIEADNLRRETMYGLCHILPTCEAARCYIAIADVYSKLRRLSSLWHLGSAKSSTSQDQ